MPSFIHSFTLKGMPPTAELKAWAPNSKFKEDRPLYHKSRIYHGPLYYTSILYHSIPETMKL